MRSELPAVILAGLLIAMPALGIALFGDAAYTALRYDNLAMTAGEWWRGLTGHWVHLGREHLVLNMLSLAILTLLVGPWLGPAGMLLTAPLAAIGISAAFWLLHPELFWYAGLSGVTAALWAAGAIRGFRGGSWFAALVLLALVAKLAADFFTTAPVSVSQLIGGPVVIQAHLYGALAGVCIGLLLPRPG
ncbi:rhomboid family GlyGly-CTERM serine protease [Natronocella acetinitrilica]|uniref:Rhomboid family GlyGly-CTERM serine protease n=1 Tax=Natronocella acetinitrilica TaxID=414046 RepID=A0AAE3G701_9GAMM|nr:rhombosortase [Natronocella acetinitrilica]MCP1675568.1 rhomboid family GlyGly-CTERM serine protease [Natronocella acetinitrilica]